MAGVCLISGGEVAGRGRVYTQHTPRLLKPFFSQQALSRFLVGCSHLLGCNDTSLGET